MMTSAFFSTLSFSAEQNCDQNSGAKRGEDSNSVIMTISCYFGRAIPDVVLQIVSYGSERRRSREGCCRCAKWSPGTVHRKVVRNVIRTLVRGTCWTVCRGMVTPFLRLETHLNETATSQVRWCREANGDSERFHGLRGRWAFVVARRRRANRRRARTPLTSQALAMRSIGAVAMWTTTLP